MNNKIINTILIVSISILITACSSSSSQTLLKYQSMKTTVLKEKIKNFKSEKIIFNGLEYYTVISPFTGEIFLDRNLGAKKVCNSIDDKECFGDYYQWGRLASGYENVNSEVVGGQALSLNKGKKMFVYNSNQAYEYYDWADSIDRFGTLRNENTSRTDGKGMCPTGFRLPTSDETYYSIYGGFNKESKKGVTLFNSFLKIPKAGHRDYHYGGFVKTSQSFWYRDKDMLEGYNAYDGKSSAFPVRCIQDTTKKEYNLKQPSKGKSIVYLLYTGDVYRVRGDRMLPAVIEIKERYVNNLRPKTYAINEVNPGLKQYRMLHASGKNDFYVDIEKNKTYCIGIGGGRNSKYYFHNLSRQMCSDWLKRNLIEDTDPTHKGYLTNE